MTAGIFRSSGWWAPVIAGLLVFLLAACGTTNGPDTAADDSGQTQEAAGDAPTATSEQTAARGDVRVERDDIRPDAPIRYTVQRGDTLWDIAARFLDDPWVWPEVWEVNPGIENPHLIYPGDVITLAWRDGEARLVVDRPGVEPSVRRLSPEIRRIPLDDAIDTVPADTIRQFLNRPHVVRVDDLDDAPYVVGNHEGRTISATGDEVFVRGMEANGHTRFSVVRRGQPLIDPESGDVLGYEAIHLAEASLLDGGDPARMRLERAEREVLRGDRLIGLEYRLRPAEYIPRQPAEDIDGQIIALFDAISRVGSRQIVMINRGEQHGIEIGTMLGIDQSGGTVRDTYAGMGSETVELPRQRVGTLMVFEVFDRLSYALVMTATHPVRERDHLSVP